VLSVILVAVAAVVVIYGTIRSFQKERTRQPRPGKPMTAVEDIIHNSPYLRRHLAAQWPLTPLAPHPQPPASVIKQDWNCVAINSLERAQLLTAAEPSVRR
jgi:hypothetical protein